MWSISVKGEMPTQFAPSPPMWVKSTVLREGIQDDMPWQPIPPPATLPSGTSVEVLCGQPEQKLGMRVSEVPPVTSRSFGFGRSPATASGAELPIH
jgi:hypothetical protein